MGKRLLHRVERTAALQAQPSVQPPRNIPETTSRDGSFENEIMACRLARHTTLAFRSVMEFVGPRREFNRGLVF